MAYSVDLRQRIVHAVLQRNFTLQQAADTFELGLSTVGRYGRRYREGGDLTAGTSPGRPGMLPSEQVEVCRQQVDEHNDFTLEQPAELWEQTTGVQVSSATVCRWIKRLDVTRKKTLSAREQDAEARRQWFARLRSLDPRKLVFADESGFALAMTPLYAYAPKRSGRQGAFPRPRREHQPHCRHLAA